MPKDQPQVSDEELSQQSEVEKEEAENEEIEERYPRKLDNTHLDNRNRARLEALNKKIKPEDRIVEYLETNDQSILDAYKFHYFDYILIDEGQDVDVTFRDLICVIFNFRKIIVADGIN